MADKSKEIIIISLGGSLVAPDGNGVNVGFLKNFQHCLQRYFILKKFIIVVGGGKICRLYQKSLLEFSAKEADRDWMGINVSRLNAEVVRQCFKKRAYPKVIIDPTKKVNIKEKNILVAAGYKPGWSTDYCSVLMAKTFKVPAIVNLTNIDYVYNKDPGKFPDAKIVEQTDWPSFRKITGDKWEPGLSLPFDPRAAKMAEKLKLKVAVINGKRLERLEDFLNGKQFVGTTIQ